MKKVISFLFILFFLYSNICFSQSGWFWQNPYPTGNDLEKVRFYDENTGYAVGWRGTVIKTTNGGDNWFLSNSGVLQLINQGYYAGILRCINIIDSNKVIVAGNGIIKTTNSGASWFLVYPNYVNEIFYANENTGYFIDATQLFKTVNGGYNWSNVLTSTNGLLLALYFVNENTGFVSNIIGDILKTTDAGQTWSSLNFGNTSSVRSILFVNASTGFCVTYNKKIFKTTNSGVNWTLKYSGGSEITGEFSFSSQDSGYYCNWGGKVFKTCDGGETWDSSQVVGLTVSISSPKNNICIIVGTGGLIYKTVNSGTNWIYKSSELGFLNSLTSVYFPSQNIGYISGDGGIILKTVNSGANWFRQNSNVTNTLTDLYFLDVNNGFSAGSVGKVICTTNGGINWISLNSAGTYHLYSICFLDNLTGFVSGVNYLYKTTNKGSSWYTVQNDQTIKGIQFINSLTGFSFGTIRIANPYAPPPQTHVLKTTNRGENWSQICFLNNVYFNDMMMINENTGYAIQDNYVFKTTNGGFNWFDLINNGGNCIYFTDQNTGYIPFYKTTNGGLNWYFQNLDIQANWLIYSIGFVNDNTGFMVGGYGGTIFKTTDGGGLPIGIEYNSGELPTSFSLSQNYPNPFNPVTKIKYDIPAVGQRHVFDVRLIIFDILGREIETLVNESQKPGSYAVTWDGSRYASGVYFYRLVTDEFVETRKMVLKK